jgi:RNA polymerase sigma factor (sigma-70 family)
MPTGPASRLMPKLRRVALAEAVSNRTDGQLLGAFVNDRDADAFAGLVRRHGPMVLGVCRRVTGNHTTADDAFQAVFLVLARRAAAVKPREQVGNWLYGVAYRTAIKARAVQARRWSREKQVDVMPEPTASSPPDVWSDLQPVIDEELARLPDNLRLPIVLCDLEGRAQREVAKHLGVPPATLATRLASARRMLAQRLTRRGVTLSGGALAGLLTTHGTVAAVSHSLAYGLAQAAESVAGGGIATSLVSSHAIQLSEGVIRMMLLTKLKAIAVTALTVAALSGGLGLGLVPAFAGDDPAQTGKAAVGTAPQAANTTTNTDKQLNQSRNKTDADVDDTTFLKRLIFDLRGTSPTDVENWYFIADQDADKRAKVVVWMSEDEVILARLAKKLGVPADRVRLVRVLDAKNGKATKLVVIVSVAGEPKSKSVAIAFSPDGKQVAARMADDVTLWTSGDVRLWNAETGREIDAPKKSWQRRNVVIGENNNPTPLVVETLPLGESNNRTPLARGSLSSDFLTLEGTNSDNGLLAVINQNIPLERMGVAVLDYDSDGLQDLFVTNQVAENVNLALANNSDEEFLKQVLLDVRGTPPTTLELKYFSEDKDPKKREKLLDTLLKDPAVAKKVGDEWKKKMLETPPTITSRIVPLREIELTRPLNVQLLRTVELTQPLKVHPSGTVELTQPLKVHPSGTVEVMPLTTVQRATTVDPQSNRLEKLVHELLAAKKTDAEMLEAVTLATVGRLPTDAEKRLTLGLVTKATDRKAAWVEVAKALAATEEGAKRK